MTTPSSRLVLQLFLSCGFFYGRATEFVDENSLDPIVEVFETYDR